jgi:DNA-binding GntR family transcriptional regulator
MPTASTNAFAPIRREPLREVVAASLRDAILAGAIKPRERIIEMALAASMGVSRAPVREAMALLEREGLLTRSANHSATVLEFTAEDESEIRALRTAQEALAVRLLIRFPDSGRAACLEQLRGNQRRMAAAAGTAEKIALDLEFHELLVRGAGNSRLIENWVRLRRQVQLLMHQREARGDDTRALTVIGHERIIQAIAAGDEAAAVREIENQLED